VPPAEPPRPPARAETSFVVPENSHGQALDRTLRTLLNGESWGKVRRWITSGKLLLDGRTVTDPQLPVRAGQTLEIRLNAPRPRAEPLSPDAIVYVDTHLVVVHKPAGISTVPYDESERDTLDRLTANLLAKSGRGRRVPLGIVQRLDKETTGVLVFARTPDAKRELKNQFRFHTVARKYWAIAHGQVSKRTLTSRLVQDRGDGMRGSTENPKLGREATTHVEPLRVFAGATLLECRLETGRTHQIRIHLSEAGHPLLGERPYTRGYEGQLIDAPRVMLHAFLLGFEHPVTGKPMSFQAPMPEDMTDCIRKLEALSYRPAPR
jgi:23S rRNA pseudouridine1911/1915/1917 synthase